MNSLDAGDKNDSGDMTAVGTITLDDVEHGVLANAEPMADFSIRLPGADELKHLGGVPVRDRSLAALAAEAHAALARRGNPRAHALT